jgi:two-component system response regulator DevR
MSTSDTRPRGFATAGILVLAAVPAIRDGLASRLESEDFGAVKAGSADEAYRQILAQRPALAVVDLRLTDSTAVEFCRAARGLLPGLRFLLLTSFVDHRSVQQAVLAGASGLVLRELRHEVFRSAIRQTLDGANLLDAADRAEAVREFLHFSDNPLSSGFAPFGLTPTQGHILALAAQGMGDRSISRHVPVSLAEVPNELRRALSKLGIDPLDHGPSGLPLTAP